jgi:tRNA(Ile)-lysidine synthetase-like protein
MNNIKKRPKIGLAVSGGIDSCYLMHNYAQHTDNVDYVVLSVNHNLRPISKDETLWVQKQAHHLGLECHILNLTAPKPQSGIQEFARRERYELLAQAAKQHHLEAIYLGHHSDDQAETILSRLNHDSGLSGLCGMPEIFFYDNVRFERPLLNLSRSEIDNSMQNKNYLHDPSNDNIKYERVRNRQFLAQNLDLKNALLGLSIKVRQIYYPLYLERNNFLKKYVHFSPYGYCYIQHQDFCNQSELLQSEILKYAIKYVTGNFYIKNIPASVTKNFTLSGAEICFTKEFIKIYRENRNLPIFDTKRFIKTPTGYHKDDKDIPFKARQSLPNEYFMYQPYCLEHFVTVFDHYLILM